jgi:hypothetical protein
MKKTHVLAVLLGVGILAIIATEASAMYNPSTGTWLQRDPGPDGMMAAPRVGAGGQAAGNGFLPRDPAEGVLPTLAPGPVGQLADSLAVPERDRRGTMKGATAEHQPRQYSDGMNLYVYGQSRPANSTDPTGLSVHCGDVTCRCGGNVGDIKVPWYGCSNRAKFIIGIAYPRAPGGCVTPGGSVYCTGDCNDTSLLTIMGHECCHACASKKGFLEWLRSWIPGDIENPKFCDTYAVSYSVDRKGP